MKEQIKNIPQKIYLQIGDEVGDDLKDFNDLYEEAVCWHSERVFENDIEYVLQSSIKEVVEDKGDSYTKSEVELSSRARKMKLDFLPGDYALGWRHCFEWLKPLALYMLSKDKHFKEDKQAITDSEIEDLEGLANALESIVRGERGFADTHKKNWNLETVQNWAKEALDKYYYKDSF